MFIEENQQCLSRRALNLNFSDYFFPLWMGRSLAVLPRVCGCNPEKKPKLLRVSPHRKSLFKPCLGPTCALLAREALQAELVEKVLDQTPALSPTPAAQGRWLHDLSTKDCSSQTWDETKVGIKAWETNLWSRRKGSGSVPELWGLSLVKLWSVTK